MGRHIVEQLLERGESVAVFSRVQRHYDVPFYSGDINDESQISQAIQKVRDTVARLMPVLQCSSFAFYSATMSSDWRHMHIPYRLSTRRQQRCPDVLEGQRRRDGSHHSRLRRERYQEARLHEFVHRRL